MADDGSSENQPVAVRPRVFIGSSSEGLDVASSLQVLLDHDNEVEIWTQGLFEPGGSTLQSLVNAAENFDFAILVVSPDDTTISRGIAKDSTRDNVIFELGLFMGHLGPQRTFMVFDRQRCPDLPSDLAGVTSVAFARHHSGNMDAALGQAVTLIGRAIRRLGLRKPYGSIGNIRDQTVDHNDVEKQWPDLGIYWGFVRNLLDAAVGDLRRSFDSFSGMRVIHSVQVGDFLTIIRMPNKDEVVIMAALNWDEDTAIAMSRKMRQLRKTGPFTFIVIVAAGTDGPLEFMGLPEYVIAFVIAKSLDDLHELQTRIVEAYRPA